MPSPPRPVGPVHLADRIAPLDAELIGLLRGLRPDDWDRPTACALWSVKDIVAHLLDGNLRRLSFQRDGLPAKPDVPIHGHSDLVRYLERAPPRRGTRAVSVEGDQTLGAGVFDTLAVMA